MVNGKAKNIISHTKISSTEVKDNYCNIVANINVIRTAYSAGETTNTVE